ncbi:ATP-binding protein [Suttonella ornithocola]|uniref:histidine kinase n=1 Tax=Suttonella ornithocola TaxID=279832 RepID=A0A380N023_9GAMM|nr:ATP-binding protein [Suttonella ornithocola]SUO97922.1 Chemotaxis protein CheA [Suttonella ornithocola]
MDNRTGFLKRYRGLIASVTLFIMIIIGLLGLNTYSTREVARLQDQLLAASEMRSAIQTVTRDLYDMKLSWGEDPESPHIRTSLERLEAQTSLLAKFLNAFKNGGEVSLITDDDHDHEQKVDNIYLQSVENDPELKLTLSSLTTDWNQFEPLVKEYYKGARDIFATETPLDLAVNEAQISSARMYNDISHMANIFSANLEKNSNMLAWAQYIGIAVTMIYFLIFMFYFVRQLIRSDVKAEEARKETEEILDTVQEGLFLVGPDMRVGHQQSKKLLEILPGMKMQEQSLGEVLGKIISDRDVADTQSYIDQLFKPRIKESLIRSLNPLNRIQVFFDNGRGDIEDRYLKFDFNRVYEDKEIKRVLVSVTDITQEVELENRLEKEREQNNRQIELLVKVLRVNPSILESYMRNGYAVTNRINAILRRSDKKSDALHQKVEEIFREVHSFKGESSALEFEQFVVLCQEMETKLKGLREKNTLAGDDFLSVAVSLDAIIEQLNVLKALQDRLRSHSAGESISDEVQTIQSLTSNVDDKEHVTDRYLESFAHQVAKRNKKSVNVIVDGFDHTPFNEERMDMLKSIAIQLIRNSIVHGIELPQERLAVNKEQNGNLGIHLRKREGFYDLIIEDDGNGIDVEALREKLRHVPNFKHNPDEMTDAQLYQSIFVSGVSTSNDVTEDAGQGVGMNVVRDRVRSLGAKVAINSKPREFTRFVIRIPAER